MRIVGSRLRNATATTPMLWSIFWPESIRAACAVRERAARVHAIVVQWQHVRSVACQGRGVACRERGMSGAWHVRSVAWYSGGGLQRRHGTEYPSQYFINAMWSGREVDVAAASSALTRR